MRAVRAEAAWLAGDLHRGADEALAGLEALPEPGSAWGRGELALALWRCDGTVWPGDWIAEPYRLHLSGEPSIAADIWQERGCPYDEADALADTDNEQDLRRAFSILDLLDARPRLAMVTQRMKDLGVGTLPRPTRASTKTNPMGLTPRGRGRSLSRPAPHERRDRGAPVHLAEDRRPPRVGGALEARREHSS